MVSCISLVVRERSDDNCRDKRRAKRRDKREEHDHDDQQTWWQQKTSKVGWKTSALFVFFFHFFLR